MKGPEKPPAESAVPADGATHAAIEGNAANTVAPEIMANADRAVIELAAVKTKSAEPPKKLRVLDMARMLKETPPPIPWRIKPLAVDGALTLLPGREGQGKSLLSQALAGAVVRGETLAGFECKKGRVMIVDAENGEREIHRRVHGLDLPETIVPVLADGFHLLDDLDLLDQLLVTHRPNLLILDSFKSLWLGGDERDTDAASEVLLSLQRLIRFHDVATILLHHSPKNGADYRGDTGIGAVVELGFTMSRALGDPQKRTRRKLKNWKLRADRERDDAWISIAVEEGRVFLDQAEPFRGGDVDDDDAEPEAPIRAQLTPMLLANITEAAERDEPLRTLADLCESLGRPPKDSTVRRIRDGLVKSERIVKTETGFLPGVNPPKGANPVTPLANHATEPNNGKVSGCHTPKETGKLDTLASIEIPQLEPGVVATLERPPDILPEVLTESAGTTPPPPPPVRKVASGSLPPKRRSATVSPAELELDHAEALIEDTFGPVERIGDTA